MTLREWLDVYTHNGDAQLVCAWRKRAWRAMRPVVQQFVTQREAGIGTPPGMLLQGIDAAAKDAGINPDTKRWRQEREKLLGILQGHLELWPTASPIERGAVEVAIDLHELGNDEGAREMLAKQAPNALNRKCPACGAKPGELCFDAERHVEPSYKTVRRGAVIKRVAVSPNVVRENRIVPHLARVS